MVDESKVTPVRKEEEEQVQLPIGEDADVGGADIPSELAILPLRGVVVYPLTAVPLNVGQARSIQLVDDAVAGNRIIGLVASKDPELEEPSPD